MEKNYDELKRWFDDSPYARKLGMRIMELSEGYVKIQVQASTEYNNWEGRTHGGFIMSLADHAFGTAFNTLDRIYVALQFNANFLSAPKEDETLTAEGRVLHAGKRAGMAEMIVRGADGRTIATATGTVISLGERANGLL